MRRTDAIGRRKPAAQLSTKPGEDAEAARVRAWLMRLIGEIGPVAVTRRRKGAAKT
jgi:hypothetical protein